MFVENLLKKAFDITTRRSARTLTTSHMFVNFYTLALGKVRKLERVKKGV